MTDIFVILFFLFILLLVALDIFMVVSLIKPGDERRQMVVWKASTYTLLATIGAMTIQIMRNFIQMEAMRTNPFTQLAATAIVYFFFLLYYKRQYGG